MMVDGIEIKEGYLIQVSYLPGEANEEELNSFYKVAHCSQPRVEVCIELSSRFINLGYGWNDEYWCDRTKRYWRMHTPGDIVQVKGYFSNEH